MIDTSIKEFPILFSTEMVNAIEEGRKTATRRILNPQPNSHHWEMFGDKHKLSVNLLNAQNGLYAVFTNILDLSDQKKGSRSEQNISVKCRYASGNAINDRLWVRETWCYAGDNGAIESREDYYSPIFRASENGRNWEKNSEGWKWRPNIFMKREICRILLATHRIGVQRIQEITEDDCIKEGVESIREGGTILYRDYLAKTPLFKFHTAKESFRSLWFSINGQESWEKNVWVWAIDFEKIQK